MEPDDCGSFIYMQVYLDFQRKKDSPVCLSFLYSSFKIASYFLNGETVNQIFSKHVKNNMK